MNGKTAKLIRKYIKSVMPAEPTEGPQPKRPRMTREQASAARGLRETWYRQPSPKARGRLRRTLKILLVEQQEQANTSVQPEAEIGTPAIEAAPKL